jgi:putative transposase
MSVIDAAPKGLSVQRICAALGTPRHAAYPDRRQRKRVVARRAQPRALSPEQQAEVRAALHGSALCDLSPRQAHARLLEAGTVLASVSTFYRLLRANGESVERRLQRPPQRHSKPQLTATAPHQVWTWDITKLPTHVRGVYLSLYVILDLFTRYVVGWMISRKENAGLANHLFQRVIANYGITGNNLIVHSDRGPPMISHSYADLLASLGVERSYSRPRISNDNAFSEAQFKTLKYDPSYPGRFDDIAHAREWTRAFIDHYNHRPHEGLAMFAPAQVLHGEVDAAIRTRQRALDAHYASHPERYVKGPPVVARPPAAVQINPDHAVPAAELLAKVSALRRQNAPDDAALPQVVM